VDLWNLHHVSPFEKVSKRPLAFLTSGIGAAKSAGLRPEPLGFSEGMARIKEGSGPDGR
jgi:hypothetical protein